MNYLIDFELAKLVHPLSGREYQALKGSIKKCKGNIVPILVNGENVILDGHHRYKACNELNIDPRVEIMHFDSKMDEKKFVCEVNLKRRHLNDFQKAELAITLEGFYKEEARLRQLSKLKNVGAKTSLGPNDPNDNELNGRTSEIVARQAGISATIYKRSKKIIEQGSEQAKHRLRVGNSRISKEYQRIIKAERIELAEKKALENPILFHGKNSRFDLKLGAMQEKGKEITYDSIDMIFTDPPYKAEYLYLYDELAKLAGRALKPGGSLCTFVGHYALDIIFDKLRGNSQLKYAWQFIVKHNGRSTKIWNLEVWPRYKPLLWFFKPDDRGKSSKFDNVADLIKSDYIESQPVDKIFHKWEQSVVEAEHLIKPLTVKGQVILDPFMGFRTTGEAALQLNRKFIGIEIDKEHYSHAAQRLTKFVMSSNE